MQNLSKAKGNLLSQLLYQAAWCGAWSARL